MRLTREPPVTFYLTDYIKATGDRQGAFISSTQAQLTMHNNTRTTPVGKVMLRVERGGNTHLLHFFVMKSAVMPILGKNSSLGMKLVQILDCDNIHSVNAQNPPEVLSDPILSVL